MIKADQEQKDQEPLYCLSFSPNWNTYQSLSINNSGLLAYGSNSETFFIDIPNKNFISSVKPSENIPNSQLKVTSSLLEESLVFVGFSNGVVYAFNHKLKNQVVFTAKISENQIMHIARRENSGSSFRLLILDSEGKVYELVYIQEIVKVFPLNINCESQVVKICQFYYQPLQKTLLLTVSQRGQVSLWDLETKSEVYSHNIGNTIYKADCIIENKNTLICGVIGKKDVLYVLNINIKELYENKSETQPGQVYTVKLHFQLQTKDPELLGAKPHIMFLNTHKVLISGKKGELFIISMETIQSKQEIELKHLSAVTDEEPLYEVVDRNPHYKQIYAMEKYTYQNETILLSLGIDRRLCFWKFEDDPINEIEHLWSINFLGSKIKRIGTSTLEKNKLFMTCLDKTIRVWDLEKKNNKFSTQEIWKQVSQTQVIHLNMHPEIEGICAYTTEDTKICMYDLATQVCFKVLKLEKGIRSIRWVPKELQAHFVNFATAKTGNPSTSHANKKEEGEEEKVNVKYGFQKSSDPKFTQELKEDYILVAFLQDNYFMFLGVNEGIDFYQAQTLVNQDSFDHISIDIEDNKKCLLIATGSKEGKCSFWRVSEEKAELMTSFKHNNFHLSCIRFHRTSDNTILCATSSHDRKIVVYEIDAKNEGSKLGINVKTRLLFKHRNKVDQVKWSVDSYLLAISYQDKTVQVWDCSLSKEDKESKEEFLPVTQNRDVCNIRGHDGYITDATFSLYDNNILVTASDDQTVKVWDINKIVHKSLANPNKKKNKKKKNKHKGNPLEEDPGTQKKIKVESDGSPDLKEELEVEAGQEEK